MVQFDCKSSQCVIAGLKLAIILLFVSELEKGENETVCSLFHVSVSSTL